MNRYLLTFAVTVVSASTISAGVAMATDSPAPQAPAAQTPAVTASRLAEQLPAFQRARVATDALPPALAKAPGALHGATPDASLSRRTGPTNAPIYLVPADNDQVCAFADLPDTGWGGSCTTTAAQAALGTGGFSKTADGVRFWGSVPTAVTAVRIETDAQTVKVTVQDGGYTADVNGSTPNQLVLTTKDGAEHAFEVPPLK
ncbi:hypothetical protein AB0L40_13890 [Patulibacter sp. NPDC049589]|uniref:hypothetical protein n=1 Tax=Patulibacter sp. NPDC049589 TaxID=3154731 RepID=UPI0034121D3C